MGIIWTVVVVLIASSPAAVAAGLVAVRRDWLRSPVPWCLAAVAAGLLVRALVTDPPEQRDAGSALLVLLSAAGQTFVVLVALTFVYAVTGAPGRALRERRPAATAGLGVLWWLAAAAVVYLIVVVPTLSSGGICLPPAIEVGGSYCDLPPY